MTEERPPGDPEAEPAQLELDDFDDESFEDVPEDVPEAALETPPSADGDYEDDHEPSEAIDGFEDDDALEPAATLGGDDYDADDDNEDDPFADDDKSDYEEDRPSQNDSEDLLRAAAATTEPSAPNLPTSWPDPIPVGTVERPATRFDGVKITPPVVILGTLVTLSFLLFVTIEPTPRWLLLFTAIIAVLGTDGALRQSWSRLFSRATDPADSTPYLFLPAMAAIAWPMLIEHNVRGFLVLPAALLAGLGFTAIITAQISSVRIAAPVYPIARLASTAAVYFTAFALFSLSYVLDVELAAGVAAVAVIAAMLGVEVFREGEVDPLETLVFSGVTGVILGEMRWAMYYVPVGGYLAGLALLLGFFLVTGLLHSHLTRRLTQIVALEYAGIATAGVVLVTIAAQAGLG